MLFFNSTVGSLPLCLDQSSRKAKTAWRFTTNQSQIRIVIGQMQTNRGNFSKKKKNTFQRVKAEAALPKGRLASVALPADHPNLERWKYPCAQWPANRGQHAHEHTGFDSCKPYCELHWSELQLYMWVGLFWDYSWNVWLYFLIRLRACFQTPCNDVNDEGTSFLP